jgi:hypothetical protein
VTLQSDAVEGLGVPVPVRLAFAHAALQVIAAEARVDILHIKGVAVDASIDTSVGSGSDADVLVRPSQIPLFLEHLESRGWTLYSAFELGSPFGHAASYLHNCWGFGDIHRHFPGIGLPADQAFERLWSTRTTKPLAGVLCDVPSLAAQMLVMVLNAARSGGASNRLALAHTAWEEAPPELREQVTALVVDLRAQVAFSAGLGELEQYRGRREYLLWKVASQGGTRLEEWVARVWAAPTPRAALRLALRAPLVNREHLAIRIGHRPTRLDVLREFAARPYRGVTQELGRLRKRRGRRHNQPS